MFKYFLMHYFHFFIYLVLGLVLFFFYKIGLFFKLFKTVKENLFFFIILFVAAAAIALRCFPSEPLIYYDEHNYLLHAQNIVEHNANALCNAAADGRCASFGIAPHGLGLSSVQALFYDYDFHDFYRKLSFLNLLFYLLNSLLIFIIAVCLFPDKNIARISSVLILAVPYNMIYATNVMPATMMNTLLLAAVFGFIRLVESRESGFSVSAFGALICTLILMASIRIEYILLLTFLLMATVWRAVQCLKNGCFKIRLDRKAIIRRMTQTASLGAAVFLIYSYAFFYKAMKYASSEARVGLDHLNFSYIQYYFSNPGFWILSMGFFAYLIYFLRSLFKRGELPEKTIKAFLFLLFFFFIGFYSFFSFAAVYRFTVPATSIYVLFATAGMVLLLKFLKNKTALNAASVIIVLAVCVFLVADAFKEKRRLVKWNRHNAEFLDIIQQDNLDDISKEFKGENYYYFKAPYLGQISRLGNYSDDYHRAVEKLISGSNLFYLENPFERISGSLFKDKKFFSHQLVYKEPRSGYRIYKIDLKADDE
ncbi:MAG: hypothetical protein AB1650_04635 [Candidatus Omnitrophota bacterium]